MTNFSLERSVEPASEPLTLTQAKSHLRVDHTDDDTYITTLITVGRKQVEEYLGRSLISQTYIMRLDQLPACGFYLLRPPVTSVTSVQYYDTTNALQTLATTQYDVDLYNYLPRLVPSYVSSWPTIYERPDAVKVTYVAGYSTIPAQIVHAIKLWISKLYETREPDLIAVTYTPTEVTEALLAPYRVRVRGIDL